MKIFVTSKMFLHDFLLKLPSSCKCDWRFPLTSNIFNYKRKHGISSLYHGIKQQVFWYQGVVTKMEIFKSYVLLQNKFRVQMGHWISASSNLLLLCLTHPLQTPKKGQITLKTLENWSTVLVVISLELTSFSNFFISSFGACEYNFFAVSIACKTNKQSA